MKDRLNFPFRQEYLGHWLHTPPKFKKRVWYPILLLRDGTCQLIDALSACSTTKDPDPGSKLGAFVLRQAVISPNKGRNPAREKYFERLSGEFLMPINLSKRAQKLILKLNHEHLDGFERVEYKCDPLDRLLAKELTLQLRGKLITDPAVVFATD